MSYTIAMPRPPSDEERTLLAAFIDAHQRNDVAASVAMMCEDIRVTMPPLPLCFDGRDAIVPLLTRGLTSGMGTWRLVPAWANRQPAAVSYLRAPGASVFRAFKIDVLRFAGAQVKEITTFDLSLLAAFGLPETLDP